MKFKIKNKLSLFIVILLLVPFGISAQKGKKKADKDTYDWRYELEVVATGIQGTYQVKVWSYSKKVDTAIEQAKKNAVHGVIFRGFPAKGRVQGKKPLSRNPNLEIEHNDFFKDFFAQGGKYLKFVSVVNNGAIAPGDRIKINKKEYKIGVVISVDISSLRKDLEAAGIIKSMSSGF
jgi:hypothetical protein